jgi:hypothetical protein
MVRHAARKAGGARHFEFITKTSAAIAARSFFNRAKPGSHWLPLCLQALQTKI